MRNQQQSGTDLTMTWVRVRGDDGRVRMESRWVSAAAHASKPKPHAA